MVTMICGLTLAISWIMYPLVMRGQRIGGTLSQGLLVRQGIYYSIPFLPSFGKEWGQISNLSPFLPLDLTFRVDPAALVLVVFTCLVWFLVAIFSQGYLIIDNKAMTEANVAFRSSFIGSSLGENTRFKTKNISSLKNIILHGQPKILYFLELISTTG